MASGSRTTGRLLSGCPHFLEDLVLAPKPLVLPRKRAIHGRYHIAVAVRCRRVARRGHQRFHEQARRGAIGPPDRRVRIIQDKVERGCATRPPQPDRRAKSRPYRRGTSHQTAKPDEERTRPIRGASRTAFCPRARRQSVVRLDLSTWEGRCQAQFIRRRRAPQRQALERSACRERVAIGSCGLLPVSWTRRQDRDHGTGEWI